MAGASERRRIVPTAWQIQERVFLADGFVFRRQQGSHRAYTKPGTNRPVVIPAYGQVPVSIIRANMKTAGVSRERYFELLGRSQS